MSDHPRIKRKDPARSAPIRDWSNMFRSPDAQGAPASPAGPAAGGLRMYDSVPNGTPDSSAAVTTPAAPAAGLSEEARVGIETAYRVIDEHLQEGRRAAQERNAAGAGAGASAAAGSAGVTIAAESIQEIVAQGIRFYSSFAPLWVNLVKSIANAAAAGDNAAAGIAAPPLARAPMPPSAPATAAPIIVEIASTRMTRITVDLAPAASMTHLAIGGLQALEPEKPPLKEISLATDATSHRAVVRIRIQDNQPAGVYRGVIVDPDSGESRGTITLRIDA
ncbi:MAG: hypothetical protein ABSC63_19500 [Candidatus Binataceae bacterium]|jgi:hypothetical protein